MEAGIWKLHFQTKKFWFLDSLNRKSLREVEIERQRERDRERKRERK